MLQGFAQQSNRKITLKLTDPKTKKSQNYLLSSIAYSCSRPRADSSFSQYSPYDAYVVSVDFKQNADEFLLNWMGGQLDRANGVITVEIEGNEKAVRTITFRDAVVGVTSESFTSGENYGYPGTQVSIYTDNLSIDNVPMHFTRPEGKD